MRVSTFTISLPMKMNMRIVRYYWFSRGIYIAIKDRFPSLVEELDVVLPNPVGIALMQCATNIKDNQIKGIVKPIGR